MEISTALYILRDNTRRQTVHVLRSNYDVTVEELASELCKKVNGNKREVTIDLIHATLPMLDEHDVVNHEDELVLQGPEFREVFKYLQAIESV